jgi:sulfur carrier protein
MNIQLNGKQTDIPNHVQTIADLYTHLDLLPKGRIIELNHTIILEKDISSTLIQESDRIEIIQFMGGGK